MNFTEEITMSAQIHSYIQLQQQIHDDLRIQHPEWVEPNGNCSTCDSYESRLAELLASLSGPKLCNQHPSSTTPTTTEINKRDEYETDH